MFLKKLFCWHYWHEITKWQWLDIVGWDSLENVMYGQGGYLFYRCCKCEKMKPYKEKTVVFYCPYT